MINSFFNTQFNNWKELESAINGLETAHERGEIFEQFVFIYLSLHTDYYQIKSLYRFRELTEDFKKELLFENTDYGIDGVWILNDGKIAAYQAKFREGRESATVRELATFWAEAQKADFKYVIANSVDLPKQANKHGYSILVDSFEELSDEFFEKVHQFYLGRIVEQKKYSPRLHQERMISNVLRGFEREDRGKLIAACGAGKTLVALWIAEALGVRSIIFHAPSLALIKQTLEAWTQHSRNKFSYLCVCSDQSVVSDIDADSGDYELSEIDFPVTTDPIEILKFLESPSEFKYVFTTYNSASSIAEAVSINHFTFNLGFFDEAHRTAGQKETEMFTVSLKDQFIPIEKRLFMTATERLISPRIKRKARLANRTIFSMDDESIYGVTFDRYTFGEAIQDKVISDYRIVLTAVNKEEVLALIQNNTLLVESGQTTDQLVSAENIFKQIVLSKAMKQLALAKTISFHSSIARARGFINGRNPETINLEQLMLRLWPQLASKDKYFSSVDGGMSAGIRKQKLKRFESAEFAVVSNAKCLTEGVDVPIIDSIYFVDPKTSLIDIVQACGRALRKGEGTNNIAHFIVPVLLTGGEALNQIDDDRFETLLNLIQALRDQDERLAHIIDQLNMAQVQGRPTGPLGDIPMVINLPETFDLTAFSNEVQLRILGANSEPTQISIEPDYLIRRSEVEKIVKPIGDYAYNRMFNNLAIPTVLKFPNVDSRITNREIRINNNNVSHTLRLGLIQKEGQFFSLTNIGKKFYTGETTNIEVMKIAMLNFNCRNQENPLFPYRSIIKILLDVNTLDKFEFFFAIYPMQNSSPDSIAFSINVILDIRSTFPNLSLVSRANRRDTLNQLNSRYGTEYALRDIWGSTTTGNRFIYFRENLSLFDGVNIVNGKIEVLPGAKQELYDLIESSVMIG